MKKIFLIILGGLAAVVVAYLVFVVVQISLAANVFGPGRDTPDTIGTKIYFFGIKPIFPGMVTKVDTNVVQASFALTRQQYMVGEPIECEFVLKNISDKPLFCVMTSPTSDAAVDILESPAGVRLRGHETSSSLVGPDELRPGEMFRWPFWLNRFVWFKAPGTYKLRLQINFGINRGKERKGSTFSYVFAEQILTLNCSPNDPQKFHAIMRSLTNKIVHSLIDEESKSESALCAIGFLETVPYLKECLEAPSVWGRNDVIQALGDIGGEEAAAAIESALAKPMHSESRQYAEQQLREIRKRLSRK